MWHITALTGRTKSAFSRATQYLSLYKNVQTPIAAELTWSTPSSHDWRIRQDLGLKSWCFSTQQPQVQDCYRNVRPSVCLVCLSHSWAVLKQLDWIEMPFCNARRLTLANSMPYCVWWRPTSPGPREWAILMGKVRPIVKDGNNSWQCRQF